MFRTSHTKTSTKRQIGVGMLIDELTENDQEPEPNNWPTFPQSMPIFSQLPAKRRSKKAVLSPSGIKILGWCGNSYYKFVTSGEGKLPVAMRCRFYWYRHKKGFLDLLQCRRRESMWTVVKDQGRFRVAHFKRLLTTWTVPQQYLCFSSPSTASSSKKVHYSLGGTTTAGVVVGSSILVLVVCVGKPFILLQHTAPPAARTAMIELIRVVPALVRSGIRWPSVRLGERGLGA
jgi:hypothetical protein